MKENIDTHISHTFDAFCKTVVRNEARNIKKQYARLRERQIPLNELSQITETSFQVVDATAENSEVFIALGIELLVSNLTLSEAIHQLNEIQRKIILLYYFGGFNDREIGQIICMSGGGVWYQRKKAQSELKGSIEGDIYERY